MAVDKLKLLGIKNRWAQEKKVSSANIEWMIARVEELEALERTRGAPWASAEPTSSIMDELRKIL